jgi:hypothetical protein
MGSSESLSSNIINNSIFTTSFIFITSTVDAFSYIYIINAIYGDNTVYKNTSDTAQYNKLQKTLNTENTKR